MVGAQETAGGLLGNRWRGGQVQVREGFGVMKVWVAREEITVDIRRFFLRC